MGKVPQMKLGLIPASPTPWVVRRRRRRRLLSPSAAVTTAAFPSLPARSVCAGPFSLQRLGLKNPDSRYDRPQA